MTSASSHFLTLPAKMPAKVAGDSFRSVTPDRLYSIAIPPAIHGICTTAPVPPVACCSAGLSGTSEPAKSTVFDVSC